MKKIILTRRQIIKSLVALGAGSSLAFYWETLPGQEKHRLEIAGESSKPTIEAFAFLSSVVTMRGALDTGMMKKMYAVFLDEPWGPDHMMRCYRKIVAAVPRGNKTLKRPPMNDTSWQFDSGE